MPEPSTRSERLAPSADVSDPNTDRRGFGDLGAVKASDKHGFVLDIAMLSLVTVLLRLPAFLSTAHLTFDDGVFASSVIAMRDGGVPFRDVFSSQGPLFLPLAFVGDLAGFRTINSPRVLAVVSGIVLVAATYWVMRQMADRLSAFVAAALVSTSGSIIWVTGPLAADGPALAFAVLAFGLSIHHNRRPGYWSALLIGLTVGATLSTKAMEAPILLPVVLVLAAPLLATMRARPARFDTTAWGHAALAGFASLSLFLMVSLPFGLSKVWDQSVLYRTDAAAERDPLANARKLISTLWDRDLVLWLFLLGTLGSAIMIGVVRRNRGADHDRDHVRTPVSSQLSTDPTRPSAAARLPVSNDILVNSWVLFSVVWLVLMVSPLWRPHVSAMVPPLALLVGLYRPRLKVVLVLVVLAVPLTFIQLHGVVPPAGYSTSEQKVIEILRDLPPGAWVLSDEPGLVWRAGRRTTDDMVDPSMLRVQQGRYTENSLVEAASSPRICAVVVRSNQRFGHFTGLGDRLLDNGFEVEARSTGSAGDDQRVYVRTDCQPGI